MFLIASGWNDDFATFSAPHAKIFGYLWKIQYWPLPGRTPADARADESSIGPCPEKHLPTPVLTI